MRRAPAILLVVLFSFSLINPALLASDPSSNLPACCRRAGEHHCAMMVSQTASSGAILQGVCPLYPGAKAGPVSSTSDLARIQMTHFGFAAVQQALHLLARPLCRSSYRRTGEKRGPPSTAA
jgi:hypothetical protein